LEIEVEALRTEVATTQYQSPPSSGGCGECVEYVDDVADWAEDEIRSIYNILNDFERRIYNLE